MPGSMDFQWTEVYFFLWAAIRVSPLFKETLHFLPHCLCLRVQPPSWKLKNPREHRSHLGPVTPGWHRHWPVSSQSNDLEPNELQWHGTHIPPVVRPWVWGWKNTEKDKGVVNGVKSRRWRLVRQIADTLKQFRGKEVKKTRDARLVDEDSEKGRGNVKKKKMYLWRFFLFFSGHDSKERTWKMS